MANYLISGPSGAGKSTEARRLLETLPEGVLLDFQSLYSAILAIARQDDGRFPEREDRHQYALAMAEYLRLAGITAAREMELDAVVTNSDSSPSRRSFLLGLLRQGGQTAEEVVIEPPIDVVIERLTKPGESEPSSQCWDSLRRWYKERVDQRRQERLQQRQQANV